MRAFVTVLTAGLIAASGVSASDRLGDRDYLRLARCAGLTEGSGGDVSAIDAVLRRLNRSVESRTRDRAMPLRRSASVQMRGSSGEERSRLEAELGTRCALSAQ